MQLPILNHPKITQQRFNQLAEHYEQYAIAQQTIGEQLIERLLTEKINPEFILDLGSSTGYHSKQLVTLFPQSTLINLDWAVNMLTTAKKTQQPTEQYLCNHAERLAIGNNTIDVAFSNLLLPWITDLHQFFSELKRILTPNGRLVFSTLGPNSFPELQLPAVHLPTLHTLGDQLLSLGFKQPVMERTMLTLTYTTPFNALRDLKKTIASPIPLSLTTVKTFKKNHLPGQYPITLEVYYGHAIAVLKNSKI